MKFLALSELPLIFLFTMFDGRKLNRTLLWSWTLDIRMIWLETGCPYLGMRSME
jgi:hypothetical protein